MKRNMEFDCVEMKRKAQERIQAETEGMDQEQLLKYWEKKHLHLIEIGLVKKSKVVQA